MGQMMIIFRPKFLDLYASIYGTFSENHTPVDFKIISTNHKNKIGGRIPIKIFGGMCAPDH